MGKTRQQGKRGQMTHVRMGVVGTGRMAATMIGAAARIKSATVSGVASASGSTDRARSIATAFGIDHAYGDPAPLFARNDIDLIYVATETHSHARVSVAALEAGKSVLCEKPFATSLREGQLVVDAARRSKALFVEAVWTMLLPAYRRAKEIVRSKEIGATTHLTASFGYPTSPSLNRGPTDAYGGVLLDRAIYPISLAITLMGPVEYVDAAIIHGADEVDVEASLQLVHTSGGHSQLTASLSTLLSNEAVISGTGGSVTIEAPLLGSELITIRQVNSDPPSHPAGTHSPHQQLKEKLRAIPAFRRLHRQLAGGRREHHHYGANQYLPLLEHVVELVSCRRTESHIVPLDLSVEVARVTDLARSLGSKLHYEVKL